MKSSRKLFWLAASFATGLLSGCSSKEKLLNHPELVVSNVTYPNGMSALIMVNTNGVSATFENQKVIVHLSLNSSMTISFNGETRVITSVVLEKPSIGNEPGEYIFDFNGDGIPDQRHIKNTDYNDLFYDGKWYAYKPGAGKAALIDLNGKAVSVVFDGTRWKEHVNDDKNAAAHK